MALVLNFMLEFDLAFLKTGCLYNMKELVIVRYNPKVTQYPQSTGIARYSLSLPGEQLSAPLWFHYDRRHWGCS